MLLDYGLHTYTIHYTMTRMGRIFADHDELYLERHRQLLGLPHRQGRRQRHAAAGRGDRQLVGYTGPPGSTEQAVTITRTSDNTATFRTTRAARPRARASPSPRRSRRASSSTRRGVDRAANGCTTTATSCCPVLAVLLVLLYNLFAWSAVGRDPKKGTIIPLFHPPKGLSPALAHYVAPWAATRPAGPPSPPRSSTSGVKGLVTIDNAAQDAEGHRHRQAARRAAAGGRTDCSTTISTPRAASPSTRPTAPSSTRSAASSSRPSRARTARLFQQQYRLRRCSASPSALRAARRMVLFDVLDPLWLVFAAVGAMFIGIFARHLGGSSGPAPASRKLILIVWVGDLRRQPLRRRLEASVRHPPRHRLDRRRLDRPHQVVFAVLMRAPTVQGRKVMDQIDGFKMYLDTAEKNRLNMRGEPPMTVKRFERILPFAIALGRRKAVVRAFRGRTRPQRRGRRRRRHLLARLVFAAATGRPARRLLQHRRGGRERHERRHDRRPAVSPPPPASPARGAGAVAVPAAAAAAVAAAAGSAHRARNGQSPRPLLGNRALQTPGFPNARTPARTVLGRNPRAHAAQGRRGPEEGRHQRAGRCRSGL